MKHKDSTQNLILKRLLSLGSEHTAASGFTLDQIARWPPIASRKPKRDSISKALRRFVFIGIAFSPGVNQKGEPLFRIKNSEWAMAYIEGDKDKPWLPLTPTPPSDGFTEFDEHRDHYDVELRPEWFNVLQKHGREKNNQWTWNTDSFTLSVNGKSLRGQLFFGPYWRTDIKKYFGQGFLDYLLQSEPRGDFCLPLDLRGERINLGGRPTQFSASHYQAQLDIRAKKGDSNLRDGLLALTNQADFNVRVLDSLDAIHDVLKTQGDVQTKTAEALQNLVKLLSPKVEPEYEAPKKDDDGGGAMYG